MTHWKIPAIKPDNTVGPGIACARPPRDGDGWTGNPLKVDCPVCRCMPSYRRAKRAAVRAANFLKVMT